MFSDEELAMGQQLGGGTDREWRLVLKLRRECEDKLPHYMTQVFDRSKKAAVREACVYHCMRPAQRGDRVAIELGLRALLDRSKYVRFVACRLLAFAQDPKTIEDIEAARAVKGDPDGDFAAAIDAIRSQNHHYFVDREHSGHIKMDIVDLVDPNNPPFD